MKILPVAERFIDYAKEVEEELIKFGLRCEIDYRAEKIGYKIREAQLEKVPYMLIIGQKEVDAGNISVRSRDCGDMGSMLITQFIDNLQEEMQ